MRINIFEIPSGKSRLTTESRLTTCLQERPALRKIFLTDDFQHFTAKTPGAQSIREQCASRTVSGISLLRCPHCHAGLPCTYNQNNGAHRAPELRVVVTFTGNKICRSVVAKKENQFLLFRNLAMIYRMNKPQMPDQCTRRTAVRP